MAAAPINPTPDSTSTSPKKARMPLRDMIIVLVSIAAGIGAEKLLVHAPIPFGQAVVAGFAAFGGVFYFLDHLIE